MTVMLGANKSGKIVVRQGDDIGELARSFANSYSLKQSDLLTIEQGIRDIVYKASLKNKAQSESNNSEYENKSVVNDQSVLSEAHDRSNDQNYFNFSSKRNNYSNIPNGPMKANGSIVHDSENEDPNHNLMSPHFRAHSIDQAEKLTFNAKPNYTSNLPQTYENQKMREMIANEMLNSKCADFNSF